MWDEEVDMGGDEYWWLDDEYLESGEFSREGDALLRHWMPRPDNMLFEVAPQTKESFKVVMDHPDILIPGGHWYGNGRNLVAHILTVDEIPVQKPDAIWPLIEISASNYVLEPDSFGNYDYRCQISVTNNDIVPHAFSGEIPITYGYSYLGDPYTSEDSIGLGSIGNRDAQGSGTAVRPGITYVTVAEGTIYTEDTPLTSFEVGAIRFSLDDRIYRHTFTEEERSIELNLPECTPQS